MLVSANLFLFGTFEILSSNRAEFDLGFRQVLPVLIALCLGLTAILVLAGQLTPERIRRPVTVTLLAVGVLLWVQGSFLRWGYGEFDGAGIDWTSFAWQGWVDAAIWLVVLVAAVRFSRRIYPHVLFLSLAFIAVQFGVLAARAITNSGEAVSEMDKNTAAQPSEVPEAQCRLSTTRNIFHFIFDGFQTDIFMELVEEDGLAGLLEGFVVYEENVSAGARTVLSVPSVFTGSVYDGTVSESQYYRRAVVRSFHSILFAKNYVVNLAPHTVMDYRTCTHYFQRRATYAAPMWMRRMRQSTHLADLSMFRQFPHYIKRVIYNDQDWRLSALVGPSPTHLSFHHKAFFLDYINKLEPAFDEPAYHFAHFMPPHPPFVTLADGSYSGSALPHTRENYKNAARDIIRVFLEFLEKLRRLDLYESSIILAHGDHGLGMTREVMSTEASTRARNVGALLLLKTANAHGALRFSKAQTSLTDIPATLLGLLGIAHRFPGESIVELDPSRQRVRRAVFVPDQAASEPILRRWEIRGSAFDSTSWRELPPRKVKKSLAHYDWGRRVKFGLLYDGEPYLTSGWSTTSPTYTWNDGKFAKLTFGVDEPERDVIVKIGVYPYVVPGKVDRQRVRLVMNGQDFGEGVFDDATAREFTGLVPKENLRGGRLEVSFEFPDAVAPLAIGEGGEPRVLAIKLMHFETRLVPEAE